MKTSIVLVLFVAVGALAAEIPLRPVYPVFAGKLRHNGKIVGGTEVKPHSVPYQVGLFLDGYFCGGSLIHSRWVLTAAHCGELTNKPQVVLGAHRIVDDEPEQVVLIGSKPIIHEGWDPLQAVHDIALIQLPQAVELNDNIKTVSIAGENAIDYAGEPGTATGWGLAYDGASSISSVLRTVTSTILKNADCQEQFGSDITVFDTIICLDGTGGKSTCSGDSGGPLTSGGSQVGITSYGISENCEDGYAAAFTRVSKYQMWIQNIVNPHAV